MKIGLVCPYNIFRGGGVQEVVLALHDEMLNQGHQSHIITPLPRDYRGDRSDGIIFVGTSANVKSPFHTTAQVSVSLNTDEIDSMLTREQFDILHFHEPWVPIMSRQLLIRSKAKNIATFHAKLPETIMSRTIERVVTPYTKSVMKYLDQLTAVSEAAGEYVQSLTPREVQIIPNGIDLTKYRWSNSGAKTSAGTILYVGRLEKRKGVKYLLKAFALLCQQDANCQLVIAGDGVDRSKLEEFTREHNIPRVKFVGYVSEAEKLRLLATADLFCSPALYGESFGIVLLEAMACGLVIVAGNNSGYASVLKDKGALSIINPKDSREFARRLGLLLYDDTVRQVWRQWAKTYIKQFSYKQVAAQYADLYKQAIKQV